MKKRNIALGVGGAVGAAIAVKLLTRAKGVEWGDVAEKVVHADHSHFVEVDGMTLHFQEFGESSNPTLLLIHGYTASVYVWKTSAPELADNGFHVVAVDLPGFGYSDKPSSFDYSITSQARVISRLMNRLGIGRATVIGSSYGGAVAATLALDYPERVEKLVLVDTVSNDDIRNLPILRLAAIPGVGEVIMPFLADSKMFLKHRMYRSLAKENHHLIDADRIENVRRPLHAADAHRSLLATSRNWQADRIEQDAHLIKQPTLIIWGEEDALIPIRNGYKLHGDILNSRFVVLKKCGHVPQEEKSEVFTEIVTQFCRDKKGHVAPINDESVRVEA